MHFTIKINIFNNSKYGTINGSYVVRDSIFSSVKKLLREWISIL